MGSYHQCSKEKLAELRGKFIMVHKTNAFVDPRVLVHSKNEFLLSGLSSECILQVSFEDKDYLVKWGFFCKNEFSNW